MNEPKDIAPEPPDEDEPQDAPPAPAADPPPQDEPDLPEPEPEPEPEPAPAVEDLLPGAEAAPDDHADLFADEPEAEPEPEPEAVEPLEPEPAAEAAPEVEAAPAEPAPPEAIDDDLHGPEPWEHAPETRETPLSPLRDAEPEPAPAAEPAPPPLGPAMPRVGEATYEVKRSAFAIYLAYLTALMGVGLPVMPFACWWAYKQRREAPAWLKSHYTFQIRTFWIVVGGVGLAALVLFLPFALFPLTIVATAIWLVARCFVGMVRLHRGEPIFHPQTWTV